MHYTCKHCSRCRGACRWLQSHDFTMVTHSEHAHDIIKWHIGHTQSLMHRTHPQLRNCRDNAKLACHCTAHYQMEWIYTQTKMSSQGSLELALEMRNKERKKERLTNGYFHEHLILAYTIVLMNDLGLIR